MELTVNDLLKDLTKVNIADILSAWQWCLGDVRAVVAVSCIGDLFLMKNDDTVYWLRTDDGSMTKVANGFEEFQLAIAEENNIDNWLLRVLVEKLIVAGKVLKENQVYSFKVMPVLGGEYSVDNIDPVDISVHFALTGQICEQIKDLPDGTKVKTVVIGKSNRNNA